jgi:hypothetical protein
VPKPDTLTDTSRGPPSYLLEAMASLPNTRGVRFGRRPFLVGRLPPIKAPRKVAALQWREVPQSDYHFDVQGMIGTTLIAFSGEPFTILELTAR